MFEKPLNPVLGETYQAKSPDGAMVYMEQTCHHPPVSHMLVEGPEGRYRVSGYSECVVKFAVTSINVTLLGHKQVEFQDGQTIRCNHPADSFYNLAVGTLYNWLYGKIEFHDKKNKIYGFYEIGKVKNRRQEYFEGAVYSNDRKVCDVFGNYAGYMDFDDKRYFDVREVDDIWYPYYDLPHDETLPSDSTKRKDL